MFTLQGKVATFSSKIVLFCLSIHYVLSLILNVDLSTWIHLTNVGMLGQSRRSNMNSGLA